MKFLCVECDRQMLFEERQLPGDGTLAAAFRCPKCGRVVAMLTTTRMWRQLRSHAIGAVNVGGTRARVRESIALCAPTAGAATVSEALRVAGLESQDARG